jgi:hypothetical protein
MTKTADLVTKPNPDLTPPAKLALIDPARCVIQAEGFAYKELFVRLPADFIADHINSRAEAWQSVQSRSGKALKKFDRVTVVAWDETWMAEAIVVEAGQLRVFFAKPKITSLGARYENLCEDENYRVEWAGSGYVVRRKRDSVVVTQSATTAALAERDLRNLYPKTV